MKISHDEKLELSPIQNASKLVSKFVHPHFGQIFKVSFTNMSESIRRSDEATFGTLSQLPD